MNIKEMTPEQIFLAENIVTEAEKAGINPNFALKLIFQETQFSPSAVGDTPEEIQDNIRVSMGMLKDLQQSLGNDPLKIAAGYFAGGSGERFAETKDINDLPPEAVLSASDLLESFGGNIPPITIGGREAFDNEPAPAPIRPVDGFTDQSAETITPEDVETERRLGQMYGAGAGTALSGTRMVRDVVRGGLPSQPAQPPAPPSPTGSMRTGPAGALPGGPQVQATTPGQKWAQAVTGVVRPGTESVVEAASDYRRAMPSGKVSKPTAQRYGINAPLDIGRIAAQNAPPPPARGLEAVTQMFQRMAQSPLGQAASATARGAGRYALPPLALASGAGEVLGGIREAQKERPDYVDVGLSGLGALGAGLSLFPATAPLGIPMAVGAPLLREFRKREPDATPVPSMELMAP
jgi:hypothetical protein